MNIKDLIKSTKGKFFVVTFIKENGDLRRMKARTGVKKGLKGVGKGWTKDNVVDVYDVTIKAFRSIRTDRVTSLQCGKIQYNVNNGAFLNEI